MTSSRHAWALAASVVLAGILAGCGEQTAAERPAGVLVDTTTVATEDVPRVIRAVGTVEAENQTIVKSEVDGQVARIAADEGARVRQGDLVLQLDATPFRLAYEQNASAAEQARVTLENDQQLLDRYSQLLEAGAIDQQSYDDVAARVKSERAALESAQARADAARWSLGKSGARAPFDGYVGDRKVELGAYVQSGDELFELVDPSPVRIAFDLPEADVGVLKPGDPVSFRVRTDPSKAYDGSVIYVSPSLDPQNRTLRAKAEHPNESGSLKPGAFADVAVTASVRKGAPVIPEEALVSEGEQSFVYVIEDGVAHKREIELGQRLDNRLEVAKGLTGGETVVVAGQRELRDGVPVRFGESPTRAAGEVGPGKEGAK